MVEFMCCCFNSDVLCFDNGMCYGASRKSGAIFCHAYVFSPVFRDAGAIVWLRKAELVIGQGRCGGLVNASDRFT